MTPDYSDPVFKGVTRPALLLGVPLIPAIIVGCVVALVGVWTSPYVWFFGFPIWLLMISVTKQDDQQFRLLGLYLFFRFRHMNRNARFWRASSYQPVKRK